MASEINRLKAVFETSTGGPSSPKPPGKPLPHPPSKDKSPNAFTTSTRAEAVNQVGVASGGSLKVKPSTTPPKINQGQSDTLPSQKPAKLIGTPPTTRKEAATHLSSVLKAKAAGSSPPLDVGGSLNNNDTAARREGGVESPRNRRPSETRKNGVNGFAASPPGKVSFNKAPAGGGKAALSFCSASGSNKGNEKLSVSKWGKGGVPASNGNSAISGDITSVFGVKLSHKETIPAHPSPPTNKFKPLQPPSSNSFRDVKLRSTSVRSVENAVDEGADKIGRDERANSVPRDIELSGSAEAVPIAKKLPRTPPTKRRSADILHISKNANKSSSTSDLSKGKGKPHPPPKKPGLFPGDKPFPPPKPSSVNHSPSRSPLKPSIGVLKNTPEFSRARRGSTPSSRDSTPSRDTPTPEKASRSRSFTPVGSTDGDGSSEDTLKSSVATHSGRGHSDTVTSTSSWVMVEEIESGSATGGSKSPPFKAAGGSPLMAKRRVPPQIPSQLKSPERVSGIDSSSSPSVNALRSKFGDRVSSATSPPVSPMSAVPRTGTPSKHVGESKTPSGIEALREKFSSPTTPTVVVHEQHSSVGESPSSRTVSGGGRSNIDSGFISDDVTSTGQVTSNENVSEEMVTPPTPLSPESEPVVEEIWDEARLEKARTKRSKIAEELLETEKTYVSRLKLIAEDFYGVVKPYSEKSKGSVTDAEVMQIFLNIQQIHQLNQTMLQSLETRIESWSTVERLGDVICRLAPFLKLYSHYTSGFEEAMKTLTECTKKDKKFDAIVREFESTTISTGLGVAHYMLEPIQRIPRYRLLLVDYLKYLPPDSPDKPDTEKALSIISEAADRNNDRIKELEISNEILSIQRSLSEYNGMLLQPSRVFIKKGTLQKMSRKNLTQRMFFLFSDVFLHTYPVHNGVYKFKDEMALCEMYVEIPTVSLFPHSFEVHCTYRSLLLVATSEEEKLEWMEALDSAINDDIRKRRSLRRQTFVMKRSQMKKFGCKAPIMIPDKSVSMCQVCTTEFTMIFRRHHCRACGKVVCSNCSQKKAYLRYLQKTERICEACYAEYRKESTTGSQEETDGSSPKSPKKQESGSGVLNLKAYDQDAVIAGYVLSQEGRKFNRVWYQVRQDCVLYKFRAHEDIKAYHSLPLPGYVVNPDEGSFIIRLLHPSKKKELGDTFKVEDTNAFNNWLHTLEKVVRMEIPSPSHQPQRNSRWSNSFEDSYCAGDDSPPTASDAVGFEGSGAHSRPDSFESYSSGSFREGSPEAMLSEGAQT